MGNAISEVFCLYTDFKKQIGLYVHKVKILQIWLCWLPDNEPFSWVLLEFALRKEVRSVPACGHPGACPHGPGTSSPVPQALG